MHGKRERHGHRVLNRSLRADGSGMALIYVSAMLPIIVSFALLAIVAEPDHTSESTRQAERTRDNILNYPVSAAGMVAGEDLRATWTPI